MEHKLNIYFHVKHVPGIFIELADCVSFAGAEIQKMSTASSTILHSVPFNLQLFVLNSIFLY